MKALTSIIILGVGVFAGNLSTPTRDFRQTDSWIVYSNVGNGVYVLGDNICMVPDPNECLYLFENTQNATPIHSFNTNASPSQIPTNLGNGYKIGLSLRGL